MRTLLIVPLLLLAGCALVEPDREGPAVLTGRVVSLHDTGIPARLTVYDPHDYRQPLAETVAEPDSGRFRIEGLPEGAVDVVIAAEGYFPQKYVDVTLAPGENVLKEVPRGQVEGNVVRMTDIYRPEVVTEWAYFALKGAPFDSAQVSQFAEPYGRVLSVYDEGGRFPWHLVWIEIMASTPEETAAMLERIAHRPEVSYVQAVAFASLG